MVNTETLTLVMAMAILMTMAIIMVVAMAMAMAMAMATPSDPYRTGCRPGLLLGFPFEDLAPGPSRREGRTLSPS